ncbi:VPLPA-CTERM-specific exosortase XrtD [uncultured Roseobacter sp.]|uniref:VPLPA-CTERM-specific exosortase XrtD n=1 Tax=uncultured Roseobacter sp. TaxID=114847 RepID=UPI0026233266|nr:VPLPA-CTERM-specific exosortase XrtD [uncultured Roseobacter sp.]
MTSTTSNSPPRSDVSGFLNWGVFWLLVTIVGAGLFFSNGIEALLAAWQLPEYSHGPLIPVLSALLFLKQLREVPVVPGQKNDRWPGVAVVFFSIMLGLLGILSNIDDIVAYALILWVAGILLISWGWHTGRHFWPGVLHLVFMLPLPGVIYFKVTTSLQFMSSELGVWFLRLMDVPVFLDGNIIDLGILKLHVAEACSGLRYMFPIMSFSYIFATLYKGPAWHKVTLLLAAVPIAIVMNSFRIAVAGVIVQYYGVEWLDGFTHFFEGWVIFLACIVILFGLAWMMLWLHPEKPSLAQALDLDTDGLGTQLARVRFVYPSAALVTASAAMIAAAVALQALPERGTNAPDRDSFALFPRELDGWTQVGTREFLKPGVARKLGADDYHQVSFVKPGVDGRVNLFMAWYDDQSKGGVHSPEVCLPGSGWEIAWLERTDLTAAMASDVPFRVNRAIIQKGETRMMVFYWFQQKERRVAWDFAAKFWLMVDGVRTGRTDGALVRLTTPIQRNEPDAAAEARLMEVLKAIQKPLPRFIPLGS